MDVDSPAPGEGTHRTRRRRRQRAAPTPAEVPAHTPAPQTPPAAHSPGVPPKRRDPGDTDRGLRALVGPGPTQVPWTTAMRVRDAARPTEEDLAEAEQETRIVRRHWTPPGRG